MQFQEAKMARQKPLPLRPPENSVARQLFTSKNSSGRVLASIRNFSNTVAPKTREIMHKKRKKTDSFCLHCPISQADVVQHQKEISQVGRILSLEKEKNGKQPVSAAFGAPQKGPSLVLPHPDC